jgi:glycosyltransferase involved in cell wall biosynthesis
MRGEFDIVTPLHNEEASVVALVNTVTSLSNLPRQWVIVDDDSTDNSLSLVSGLTSGLPNASVARRGETNTWGWVEYGKVVRFGIEWLDHNFPSRSDAPEYVAVLDADVLVEPGYFEKLIQELKNCPSGVIATGLIAEKGSLADPKPRGAARLYRKDFLSSIGGFPVCPSPDTAAVIKAHSRGLCLAIVPVARGLHIPSRGDPQGVRRGENIGRSNRINGVGLLDVFLTSGEFLLERGGHAALSYIRSYVSTRVRDFESFRDYEIINYNRGSWNRLFSKQPKVGKITMD